MCHTWLRQNSIPKCLFIISPTRSVVHKLLSQPCEVAPRANNSRSCSSWVSLKRRGRPDLGFVLRVSPVSTFCIQTLNELTATPKIRETTVLRSPCSINSTARRRRNSTALSTERIIAPFFKISGGPTVLAVPARERVPLLRVDYWTISGMHVLHLKSIRSLADFFAKYADRPDLSASFSARSPI